MDPEKCEKTVKIPMPDGMNRMEDKIPAHDEDNINNQITVKEIPDNDIKPIGPTQ